MKYLLDTNAVIGLLEDRPGIREQAKEKDWRSFGLSSIVRFELQFGLLRGTRVDYNIGRVEALPFTLVPFETDDAIVAGAIRASLGRAGRPIGAYDLLIAGQALARDLVLVTHNAREFARVEGLRVEDWEHPVAQ